MRSREARVQKNALLYRIYREKSRCKDENIEVEPPHARSSGGVYCTDVEWRTLRLSYGEVWSTVIRRPRITVCSTMMGEERSPQDRKDNADGDEHEDEG